jgi:hypothetical protein
LLVFWRIVKHLIPPRNGKERDMQNKMRSQRLLEAAGFLVIDVGRKIRPFDLFALGRRGFLLVKIKNNRGLGDAEYERLARFKNFPSGSSKQVWIYRGRCTDPHVEAIG